MKPERAEAISKRIMDAVKTSGAAGYWRVQQELAIEGAQHYGNLDSPDVIEMAIGYANLGNGDRAFEYLERGFKDRRVGLVFLKVDYIWDRIRSDPRFADLVRRVGLNT
jgi:hypothetical protein